MSLTFPGFCGKLQNMICIIILGILPLTMAIPSHQCTVVRPSDAKVRIFPTLTEYHTNKIPFNPIDAAFGGNYVRIRNISATLDKNIFVTYNSDYIIRLMLENTGIVGINSGSFLELFCLESLDLQRNVIREVTRDAFQDLAHLRYLNLSGNVIESVAVNAFDNMTHLKSLDLSFNKLQTFDCTLRDMGWLTHLNLTQNFLTTLDFKNWQLPSLHSIDVSHNTLAHMEAWTGYEYPNLTRIYLGHNLLRKLNIFSVRKMAPILAQITLEGNPWRCDVLDSMIRSLADSHIAYGTYNSTPDHIDGIDCQREKDRNATTQPPPPCPSPSTALPESQAVNVTALLRSNAEVLSEVSDLKTIVMFLFVFFVVFVLFEIVVRTGVLELAIRRLRRSDDVVLYQNVSPVENIRLLPCSSSAGGQ